MLPRLHGRLFWSNSLSSLQRLKFVALFLKVYNVILYLVLDSSVKLCVWVNCVRTNTRRSIVSWSIIITPTDRIIYFNYHLIYYIYSWSRRLCTCVCSIVIRLSNSNHRTEIIEILYCHFFGLPFVTALIRPFNILSNIDIPWFGKTIKIICSSEYQVTKVLCQEPLRILINRLGCCWIHITFNKCF